MIKTSSYSDTGGRDHNEDFVCISASGVKLCAVVADGLGGHGGGAAASRAAAELVGATWDGTVSEDYLSELVQAAHRKVLSLQTQACAMKTTITFLTVNGMKAAWAHVSDPTI